MGKLHVKDMSIDNMNLSVDQDLVTATSRQKVLALEYVWKTCQVTRTGQCHLKVCGVRGWVTRTGQCHLKVCMVFMAG